jgi:His/Glu/Gln/Arg/opine family amino acid ABC transporter permease subunit
MSDLFAVYEEHLAEWLPQLIEAAGNTIRMTVLAFILAFIVGLVLALAKLSPVKPLSWFASGYIEVMRGIPSLAILFLIYFGLADFGQIAIGPVEISLVFDAFPAAVIGFGLNGAAYMAEIFRAGILSIHGGQMEAALTVGMTPLSAMRWVILPQALRVVLPPLANFGIALLKDTSVASIISAPELMLRARDLASSSFLPMEVFLLAAAIYLALSLPVAFLTRRLEARFSRGHV